MDSLVSFIVPTHNASSTIDRCLTSIVNQDYSNLEIICCDDASTDDTWEKLKKWAEKDKRIIIIKNETNLRAAASRNKCLEVAKGEYVAQLDDDDYCAPNRISEQVSFLINNKNISFVSTGLYLFDEDGIYSRTSIKEGYIPEKKDFLWNNCFSNPSITFRRDCLMAVGGYRIAKETRRSQDYDLMMRLYSSGYLGYVMPDCLTYYYRGRNSYGKCKYEYRIDEAKIRFKNFKKLGLLPRYFFYVLKPLVVGLIPIRTVEKIKLFLGFKISNY